MANAGRNTNGSQFFIVTAEDAGFLDGNHAIFCTVISGIDITEHLERLPTDRKDRPQNEVKIEKATVIS